VFFLDACDDRVAAPMVGPVFTDVDTADAAAQQQEYRDHGERIPAIAFGVCLVHGRNRRLINSIQVKVSIL